MGDPDLEKLVPTVLRDAAEHTRGLSPTDGFVLSLFDGRRTVKEVVTEAGLGETAVLESVRKLLDLGAAEAPGYAPPAGEKPAASPPDWVKRALTAEEPARPEPPPFAAPIDEGVPALKSDPSEPLPALKEEGEEPLPAVKGEDDEPLPALKDEEEPLPALKDEEEPVPALKGDGDEPRPGLEEVEEERLPSELRSPSRRPAAGGARRVRRVAPAEDLGAPTGQVLETFVASGKTSEGNLKEEPFYQLLRRLHDGAVSGVLTVTTVDEGTWEIYLFEGHPQYVLEPDSSQRLGEALVRSGLVSPPQVERAVKLGADENRRIGLALAQLGLLTGYQVQGILRAMVEVRLAGLFELSKGEWKLVEDDRRRDDMVYTKVDVSRVLFNGLKSNFPWDRARDNLMADQDRFLRRNPEKEEQIAALHLSPKEERFVMDIVDGTKTLRQVVGYSTLKSSATYQFVHALVMTGFLEYAGEQLATARAGHIAHDLEKKLKSLSGADHFDVLEIHWSCLGREVESARDRLRREYGPDRKGVKGDPELEKMSATIMKRVEEAHRVLSKTDERRRYRRELVPDEKIRFAVDFNLSQAKNHRFTDDHAAMKECLERVQELVPGANVDL